LAVAIGPITGSYFEAVLDMKLFSISELYFYLKLSTPIYLEVKKEKM